MSLRYIKTSAPSYVTGAAMTTPEQFTDNINFYSEGYNPYQIVLESDATPPVQVGLVSMENIQQQQQQQLPLSSSEESNDVSIEDDVDEEEEEIDIVNNENNPLLIAVEEAMQNESGMGPTEVRQASGYPMRSPDLPNAVTIIPVGAGLAAEKGLISEGLPIIHNGTLPEAEINNALDDSVPALLVPVEDVVISDDGRLALNKVGGLIRAYGYRTGYGDIIYGDGLGNLFKKIVNTAKNVGQKVVNAGKNLGKKVVNVGKNVIKKGVQVGKQVLQKGVNLAKQGIKKGVQVVKTAVPKILGDVAQTAASSTISNVSDAIHNINNNNTVTGEEEVVYVDEEGNVIGQGFCGGAIYAKGIPYGGAIYAKGIYGGSGGSDDGSGGLVLDAYGNLVRRKKQQQVRLKPTAARNIWVRVPNHRGVSANDGSRPKKVTKTHSDPFSPKRYSPVVTRENSPEARKYWQWLRYNMPNMPNIPKFSLPKFNLPAGFHLPDADTIKRLLYIGVVVLSLALTTLGAMRSYSQMHSGFDGYNRYTRFIPEREIENAKQRRKARLEYERKPWDRPDVQKRMLKYLGSDYEKTKPWLFPYPEQYIYFPGSAWEKPEEKRLIKRKHFNMLLDILKKKAYEDNDDVYLFPSIDRVDVIPDIPGLDDRWDMNTLWDYAVDPLKRLQFKYRGFKGPTYEDEDDDD